MAAVSDPLHQSFANLTISNHKSGGFSKAEKDFLLQCVSIFMELPAPLASDVDLKATFGDGVLLAKFLNRTAVDDKGHIDEATVVPPSGDPHSQKAQFGLNQNRASIIKSLKDKRMVSAAAVTVEAIENANEDVLFSVIWELVKTYLLKDVRAHADIERLLQSGEKKNLHTMNPEVLLLRWINFNLIRARHNRHTGPTVSNFGSDLSDSVALTTLLFEIDRIKCPPLAISPPEPSLEKRAALTVQHATALGVGRFLKEQAILEGIEMINLAFIADLFAAHPNFTPAYVPPANPLLKWINSLGVVHIENHLVDMADGVTWGKIVDRVMPGAVDWKKVNTTHLNNIKKRGNCEYMSALVKEKFNLKMSLSQEDLYTGVEDRVNPALEEIMKYDIKTNGYAE